MQKNTNQNCKDIFSLIQYKLLSTVSGHESDNIIFSTADGEKYIFRVNFWEPDTISDSFQIYNLFHNAGIPVPLAIQIDNRKYCVFGDIED